MTDPRDCPHGVQYRKRIGLCAHCTEDELVRVEALVLQLRAGVLTLCDQVAAAKLHPHGPQGRVAIAAELLRGMLP